MTARPIEFIVIGEDKPDAQIARDLADRVFVEEGPEWLRDFAPRETDQSEEDPLNFLRKWTGFEEGTTFIKWTQLKEFVKKYKVGVRPLGHSKHGQMNKYDYSVARKAIIVAGLLMKERPIRALLLIRDMDKERKQRRDSLERARSEERPATLKVVVGIENPKREAWVLNGFEPETPAEDTLLAELRQDLGFNPCEWAERLTAKKVTAKRSAKRIVGVLTGESYEREQPCWRETTLELLKERGEATGLRDYLEEVRVRLLPLMKR